MNEQDRAPFLDPLRPGFRALSDTRKGAFVAVALAGLLNLLLFVLLQEKAPNSDGITYIWAARAISEGEIAAALTIYPMPAYPLLLAAVHEWVPDWATAGRLISISSLLGATVLLYAITAHLFDRRAAFWASVAFAFSPFQAEMSHLIYRGPVYLLFFALAIYLMVRTVSRPGIPGILAAAWMGVASGLFRIEGVFLTPVYLACIAILAALTPSDRWCYLKGAGLWLLSFILVGLAAYGWVGQGLTDANRLSEVGATARSFFDGSLLGQYRDIQLQLKAIEAASLLPTEDQNFGEVARRFMWLIYLVGLVQTLIKVLYPTYAIPLALGLDQQWERSRVFVAAIFWSYLGILYLHLISQDFTNQRFLFAASFLLYPWVGRGTSRLVDWISRRWRNRFALPLFWAFFAVLPLAARVDFVGLPDRSAMDAGRWIRAALPTDTRVIGNDLRIAYAADIWPLDPAKRFLHYRPEDRDFSDLEAVAVGNQRDLIVLKLRKRNLDRLPRLQRFVELRRFEYGSKITFVFADLERRPELAREAAGSRSP